MALARNVSVAAVLEILANNLFSAPPPPAARKEPDLVTTLEEGKAKRWTSEVVFLDVPKAFDAVSHSAILDMLWLSGMEDRPLCHVEAYLSDCVA